jgi:signal transduction histidine kinase
MNIYAFIALLNAVSSLLLGIFIYSQGRKNLTNKTFGLFCFFVTIWSGAYFIWQVSDTAEEALFWSRALMVGAIFISISYFHFILVFLGKLQEKKRYLILGYLISLFFLFANFTSFFVEKVTSKLNFPFWPEPGILYHPFLTIWIFYAAFAIYLLFQEHKKASGKLKTQIRYILFGTIIGYLGGITNYFLWYNVPIPPIGNWTTVFFLGIIAYTIIKEQLFGIRLILTQFLVGIIAIPLFINIFLSKTLFEYTWKSVLLIFFLIAGYLFIKSVLDEIRYKEELQKTYEELKVLDKAKSEFISMASHQLRTPLSATKGYISMIIEGSYGPLSEKIKEKMENVFQSNERLIKIINDLLNISKIELGKMETEIKPTKIEELIQSCYEEMKMEIEKKKLKFIFEKPKISLPKINIDPLKIRQVILNLIDNAIHYTPKGEIEIKAEKINSSIQISVRDTGEGLTEEERRTIFEGFTRGSAGITHFIEGAGLGLYIAKKYIELHRGKIRVESEGKGRGSTFYVELPIR